MAEPVPAGSDVSAGTYECTSCGNRIDVGSTKHLPPCPTCGNGQWNTVTGGDAAADPYPDSDGSGAQSGKERDVASSAAQWIKKKTGLSRD
jgi:predicted  nucleic acid-binding Zn-ribbon protein